MEDNIIRIKEKEYPIIILKGTCPLQEKHMIEDYYANYDENKNVFTTTIKDVFRKYNITESSTWFNRNILQEHTERVIIGKCSKCNIEIVEHMIVRETIKWQSKSPLTCNNCDEQERREEEEEAYKWHLKRQEEEAKKLLLEREEKERIKEVNRIAQDKKEQRRELLFKKAIQRKKWMELTKIQLETLIDICELKETDLICKIAFSGDFKNRDIWINVIDPITQRGLMEVETGCKFFVHSELLSHLKEYESSCEEELTFEANRILRSIDENISFGAFKVESPFTIYPKKIYSLEIKSNREKLFLKIESSK